MEKGKKITILSFSKWNWFSKWKSYTGNNRTYLILIKHLILYLYCNLKNIFFKVLQQLQFDFNYYNIL